MIKIPVFHKKLIHKDNHEKPWGGVYARRLWKRLLIATLVLLIVSSWAHYKIYNYYTRPVVVTQMAIKQEVTNLDKSGLDKAVADIREKEFKFNQYQSQKVQVTDPAK